MPPENSKLGSNKVIRGRFAEEFAAYRPWRLESSSTVYRHAHRGGLNRYQRAARIYDRRLDSVIQPSRRLLAQRSSTYNADKTARQILLRFGSLRIPMTPAAKFLSIAPIET